MLKVMTVFGTRPEAIKMAPVIYELMQRRNQVEVVVCVTGQHREMLDQVLSLFEIVPDYDLALMQPNQTLTELTARMLVALDKIVREEKPQWILVQGDTTTVLAASLVAFYHHVRIGHIEAGLRTGDKGQPFPEEINRRLSDVLADLYFAPTACGRDNLLREGVASQSILVTGNTVIDALRMTAQRLAGRPLPGRFAQLDGKRLLLVTAHRRENFGAPLAEICRALLQLAERYRDDVHIVYPVHYNPNVSQMVHSLLAETPNISLIEPVDYATLVALMQRAYLILTDSGGLQEEAPSLGKPVLVLRNVTERTEAVELGTARLVGTDCDTIVTQAARLLDDAGAYGQMVSTHNPYGDGFASLRIVDAILAYPANGAGHGIPGIEQDAPQTERVLAGA